MSNSILSSASSTNAPDAVAMSFNHEILQEVREKIETTPPPADSLLPVVELGERILDARLSLQVRNCIFAGGGDKLMCGCRPWRNLSLDFGKPIEGTYIPGEKCFFSVPHIGMYGEDVTVEVEGVVITKSPLHGQYGENGWCRPVITKTPAANVLPCLMQGYVFFPYIRQYSLCAAVICHSDVYRTPPKLAIGLNSDPRPFGKFSLNGHHDVVVPFGDGDDNSVVNFVKSDSGESFAGCYDIVDAAGFTRLKIISVTVTTDGKKCKAFFPVIKVLNRDTGSFNFVDCGLPDGQPLFGGNRVAKAETVVVCPSIEDAETLQEQMPETVTCAAMICDRGAFDEVDFSSIKDKHVALLVSNVSGETFAEAVVTTHDGLWRHLKDVVKIENIAVFTRAVVAGTQRPEIASGSVKILYDTDFDMLSERAAAEITRKADQARDFAFWLKEETVNVQDHADTASLSVTDNMILRPYIMRGKTTLIAGEPGIGKSCVVTALCAHIAGSDISFLESRCWTRCSSKNGVPYRVVHLTFDSDGADGIDEHRRDFAGNVGENFIQKDMADDPINYAALENREKLLGLVSSYGPPDVLVIDTADAFSHGNAAAGRDAFAWLNANFSDMALVVVEHLAATTGKVYGGTKAVAKARAIISLSRKPEQQKELNGREPTLADPFQITIEKATFNKIPEDGESFNVKFENGNFVEVDPPWTQKERRRLLVRAYEAQKLHQDEIARLFGVSDKTIRNWHK